MTDAELLTYMGTDAQKWSEKFLEVIDPMSIDIDEALMIGWFANAIEAGRAAGRKQGHDDATSGDRP